MKKLLLLTFAVLSLQFVQAQTFEGTAWDLSVAGQPPLAQISFENGEISMNFGGFWSPAGTYVLTGNTVVIDMPDLDCPTTGTYSYTITGNSLVFTVIDDTCEDRIAFFTATTWTAAINTSVNGIANAPVFQVYPNPSQGTVFLTQDQPVLMNITVFNILGEQVHEEQVSDLRNEIELGSLAKGTYVLRATTEKGNISKPIVLE